MMLSVSLFFTLFQFCPSLLSNLWTGYAWKQQQQHDNIIEMWVSWISWTNLRENEQTILAWLAFPPTNELDALSSFCCFLCAASFLRLSLGLVVGGFIHATNSIWLILSICNPLPNYLLTLPSAIMFAWCLAYSVTWQTRFCTVVDVLPTLFPLPPLFFVI